MNTAQLVSIAFSIGMVILLASVAQADPLDLTDPQERPVQVQFETSGSHLPAEMDQVYSEAILAWLTPGPGEREVTVRVPASEMEPTLRPHDPILETFSDFVWIFDARTGDVVSAELSGQFRKEVDWGFFSTRVVTDTKTRLSTLSRAGYLEPRRTLGHLVFEFCRADGPHCIPVPPRRFDPFTGYVNAVGSIDVRSVGGLGTTSFSPLGEAIFSELEPEATAVSLGLPSLPSH